MKKILSYILIGFTLLGILAPIATIQAADYKGTCILLENGKEVPYINVEESTCQTLINNNPNLRTFVSWKKNGTQDTDSNYEFLAPLTDDQRTRPFNPDDDGALGNYINVLIKIIIGLCAVLAVVMIVAGGIEYMVSELSHEKTSAKHQMTEAILGLIIALGSYALLNTINPNLLNTEVPLKKIVLEVDFQEDRESAPPSLSAFTGALPSGKVGGCVSGVVKSPTTGVVACKDISADIDKLIEDAKKENLVIWGGGFRTRESQMALRIKNCAGNTTDRDAKCTPPTALPGNSRHESGVAFDMTCNGATIQSVNNPCFIWLKANASKYGLKNLLDGSEPWHWSIDGR